MSSKGTGFGISGPVDVRTTNIEISDLKLRAATGDTTALLTLIEQHLSRLAEKYVEPEVLKPTVQFIDGAATNFSAKLDFTTTPHNSVIVCVISGTLNLYVGDYVGVPQAGTPNLGQYGAGSNTQLFFPLQGRVYTLVNPSTTVDLFCSIIPVAL